MLYKKYFIKRPKLLPLLLEILDNMCIIIICCPVCDVIKFEISGALRDLVLFAQFKKREEHPWSSLNFSKVAG